MHEVPRLFAIAEDDRTQAREQTHNRAGEDFSAVALEVTSRPVGIERPDDRCRQSMGSKIGPGVGFAGKLSSPVHRFRPGRVPLIHWRILRRSEHLTGAHVDEHPGLLLQGRLQHLKCALRIHPMIFDRIVQAVPDPQAGEVVDDVHVRDCCRSCIIAPDVPHEKFKPRVALEMIQVGPVPV